MTYHPYGVQEGVQAIFYKYSVPTGLNGSLGKFLCLMSFQIIAGTSHCACDYGVSILRYNLSEQTTKEIGATCCDAQTDVLTYHPYGVQEGVQAIFYKYSVPTGLNGSLDKFLCLMSFQIIAGTSHCACDYGVSILRYNLSEQTTKEIGATCCDAQTDVLTYHPYGVQEGVQAIFYKYSVPTGLKTSDNGAL